MVHIEVIKAIEAPAAPKKKSNAAEQLVNALNGLKKDEVLAIQPDEGKSMRGLKTSVSRIASHAGISIESWAIDDRTLYVRKR